MSVVVVGPQRWPSRQMLDAALAQLPQGPGRVVVNWGCSVGPEGSLNASPRLNALEQLTRFQTAGVLCPKFYTTREQARQALLDAPDLVWGRRLLHTKGYDIAQRPHSRRWQQSEFWVEVFGVVREEWRVQICRGRSIARGLKHPVEPGAEASLIRNSRLGWRQRHDIDPPRGVRSAAKAACAAVGYDFGAVDLLVLEDLRVVVLEVNRCPGLDAYSASAYARAFTALTNNIRN